MVFRLSTEGQDSVIYWLLALFPLWLDRKFLTLRYSIFISRISPNAPVEGVGSEIPGSYYGLPLGSLTLNLDLRLPFSMNGEEGS